VSRRVTVIAPLFLLVFTTIGCGGGGGEEGRVKTVPLTGTLLVDGQPRGGASIQFTPSDAAGGARAASSLTEEDGSFEATTYVTGDGIIPGKYSVSLGGSEEDAASIDPALMMASVQGKATSTSEVDVPKDGLTGIEIKLTTSASSGEALPPAGGLIGN
jgi:hypothetical protein